MTTFTFIEYSNDAGDYAVVSLRRELNDTPCRSLRHLDRFVAGRGWYITAMYQIDAPTLADARTGVGFEHVR